MKKILLCVGAIFLLIFVSLDAHASLVYQPPSTTNPFMAYSSNSNEEYGTPRIADEFTLSSASTITGIRWWGFDEGGGWSGTSNFTFTFYDDNSGSPGNKLLTTSGSLTPADWGNGVWVYSSVLGKSFNATAGTKYWLSIIDDRTSSIWGWMGSDGGQSLQEFNADGYWNGMSSNVAFELTGSQVPIPAAAWLLALGLIGLAVFRRRIRR